MALNSTVTSIATERSAEAEPSTAAITTFSACTGAVGSLYLPYVIGKGMEAFEKDKEYSLVFLSDSKNKLLMGLSIAALPVSIALLPITAPVLALASAKWGRKELKNWEGDLTED